MAPAVPNMDQATIEAGKIPAKETGERLKRYTGHLAQQLTGTETLPCSPLYQIPTSISSAMIPALNMIVSNNGTHLPS